MSRMSQRRVAVLPAQRSIGVIEVAIEGAWVTSSSKRGYCCSQARRCRGGELCVDLADEVRLAQAVLHRLLRRDAGDEASFRLGR